MSLPISVTPDMSPDAWNSSSASMQVTCAPPRAVPSRPAIRPSECRAQPMPNALPNASVDLERLARGHLALVEVAPEQVAVRQAPQRARDALVRHPRPGRSRAPRSRIGLEPARHGRRPVVRPGVDRREREVVERVGEGERRLVRPREVDRLPVPAVGLAQVALPVRDAPGSGEEAPPLGRREAVLPVVPRDRPVEAAPRLVQMAVHLPEPPQGGEQARLRREIARASSNHAQRHAQVVVVVLEQVEARAPIGAEQVGPEALGEVEEEGRMPAPDVGGIGARVEQLDGECADRRRASGSARRRARRPGAGRGSSPTSDESASKTSTTSSEPGCRGPQIASAASRLQPPVKTASRSNRRRSVSESRS